MTHIAPLLHLHTRTHMWVHICESGPGGSSTPSCPLSNDFSAAIFFALVISGQLGQWKQLLLIIRSYKIVAPRFYLAPHIIDETPEALRGHSHMASHVTSWSWTYPWLPVLGSSYQITLEKNLVFVSAMCPCFLETAQTNSYITFLIANAVSHESTFLSLKVN